MLGKDYTALVSARSQLNEYSFLWGDNVYKRGKNNV